MKNLTDHLIVKHKIIALYIGPFNYEFEVFLRMAYANPDFHFSHIFDRSLGTLYLRNNNFTETFDDCCMLVVRHPSLVDDLDPTAVSLYKGLRNFMFAKRFFEFERFPKIRSQKDFEKTVFGLFASNEKVLVYVGESNYVDDLYYTEFRMAVKLLPKRMVYFHTEPSLQAFPFLMNLFMFSKETVSVESLYLIQLKADGELDISKMRKKITRENIIAFVFEFFGKNKGSFGELPFLDLSSVVRHIANE